MTRISIRPFVGWLILVASLLWPHPVRAQSISGSLTVACSSDPCTTAGAVQINTNSPAYGVQFQVTGTWVGTITFETSATGVNNTWTTVQVQNVGSGATLGSSQTTANVTAQTAYAGSYFRARMNPYTSGTASIVISTVSAGGGGGGGGGGGSNPAAGATASAVPAQASYTAVNVSGNLVGQTGHVTSADVNHQLIGGVAVDTNSGTKSAGTQRMVIATDQPNLTTALNVNCTSGCSASSPSDTTASNTISSGSGASSVLIIAMAGVNSVAFTLPVANTLVAVLTPEYSNDNQTTWQATQMRAPGGQWQSTVSVSSTQQTYNLLVPGGASHVRIRASTYTSGSAAVTARATQQPEELSAAGGVAGQPIPAFTLVTGGSDGTNTRALSTDATGRLNVNFAANTSVNVAQLAGTTTDTNSGSKSNGTLRVTLATDQVQLTNALKVDGSAVTQPVSGTVTSNIGTTNGLALDSSVNGLLISQGAALGSNKGPLLFGSVTTASPTYTTGQISPLSLDTSGLLRVNVAAGGAGNSAASATGSAVPANASYGGINVAGTLRGATGVNPTGSVYAQQVDIASIAGTTATQTSGSLNVNVTNGSAAATEAATFAEGLTSQAQTLGYTYCTGCGPTATSSQWGRMTAGQVAMARSLPVTIASDQSNVPTNTVQIGGQAAQIDANNYQITTSAATATATAAATGCYVKSGTGTLNDTTNHANCKASAGNFYGFRAINTSGTIAYLRLYNLTTDPTCSSATGFVESIPIPSNNNTNTVGAGAIDTSSIPINYSTGLSYCVTGGGGNTDNTAPPAGIYITLKYK